MNMLRLIYGMVPVAVSCVALASAHANQASPPADGLPDAPGKALVVGTCTSCHGADIIVDPPRTAPVWADTVLAMKDFGATGSDSDFKTITDYLVTHLAHLEVNKAAAGEIALVFGVTEKIAEGVVAYRDMQGGFKTIDDLKKAPDLDAAKIESIKARLIFR